MFFAHGDQYLGMYCTSYHSIFTGLYSLNYLQLSTCSFVDLFYSPMFITINPLYR